MTGTPADPSPAYRITIPGTIKQQMRELGRQAAQAGRLTEYLAALAAVEGRLRTDPFGFGEIFRNRKYKAPPIHAARAYPLQIQFAIYQDERVVVLTHVRLLPP